MEEKSEDNIETETEETPQEVLESDGTKAEGWILPEEDNEVAQKSAAAEQIKKMPGIRSQVAAAERKKAPSDMDELENLFYKLETTRAEAFRILSNQIARESADIKDMVSDFNDYVHGNLLVEASQVANVLIKILYSTLEKQTQLTLASQKVIAKIKEFFNKRNSNEPEREG